MTAATGDTSFAEIQHTLQQLLSEVVNATVAITADTDLLADLQLDSIQQLALVVAIENHYQICFEPEDETEVSSVRSIVVLVQRHLARKRAA